MLSKEHSSIPQDLVLEIRELIEAPLTRFSNALTEAYKDTPEGTPDYVMYDKLRLATIDSLRTTLEGMPGFLSSDSHVLLSSGKAAVLDSIHDRFKAPLEVITNSPFAKRVPHKDREPLMRAIQNAIGKVQSITEHEALNDSLIDQRIR